VDNIGPAGKTDVMVFWARIIFGLWLLSTTILFLINYRAHLPTEVNRHIQQGHLLHVAGFFIGSILGWFGFARGSIVKAVFICAGLFFYGALLESSQILITYRYFNLNDIIANGAGIMLFLLCLPFISRLVK
jgi:VanZ family protein